MAPTPPDYTALATSDPSLDSPTSSSSPMHFRSAPPPAPSYPVLLTLLLGPYLLLILLTPLFSSMSLLFFLPFFFFLSALHALSLPKILDYVFGRQRVFDDDRINVERLGMVFRAGNIMLVGILVGGWVIVGRRMSKRMHVGGIIATSIVGGLISIGLILGWNITMGVKINQLKKKSERSSLQQTQ